MTTAVDPELNSNYHIIPGIGNFGNRYFGTDSPFDEDGDDEQEEESDEDELAANVDEREGTFEEGRALEGAPTGFDRSQLPAVIDVDDATCSD